MVKIRPKVFLKLNFEIILKSAFSGFFQKNSQAMNEVEILWPFLNPWALRESGMGFTTKNVKKAKITAP
jgi:hypothetical protein